jgi:glycosyltransferase involved in cell wall biosynthesis
MRLGIDASNLRSGGAVTHLINLLGAAKPEAHGIERVVLWGWRALLLRLPQREWLELRSEPALEGSLAARIGWQRRRLPRLASASCDLLFAPGGNAPHGFSPLVTISRNMLPFEYRELFRYGVSPMTARLLLLRFAQSRSFRKADGLIFLTAYAKREVERQIGAHARSAIVPHGVEERFRTAPRPARALADCTPADPLRLLYVSIVDTYKHQWHVADAVASLRREGLPLAIDFVGPEYPPAGRRLRAALARLDPRGEFLRAPGNASHAELPELYRRAELFVFASSCENMPNILLEAMAAGLPIACARRGPMPEVLGDAGAYFDPEAPDSIAAAVRGLAADAGLRARAARAAHARAQDFSWARCASETFAFLRAVHEALPR